jgi:hypothetical protein
MWRAAHEFTAAGMEVVPAPAGMLSERDLGLQRYLPDVDALGRSYLATYELLGEPVREFLALTHLRRHSTPMMSTRPSMRPATWCIPIIRRRRLPRSCRCR